LLECPLIAASDWLAVPNVQGTGKLHVLLTHESSRRKQQHPSSSSSSSLHLYINKQGQAHSLYKETATLSFPLP
jgi:hypothetical protein